MSAHDLDLWIGMMTEGSHDDAGLFLVPSECDRLRVLLSQLRSTRNTELADLEFAESTDDSTTAEQFGWHLEYGTSAERMARIGLVLGSFGAVLAVFAFILSLIAL